jgi:ATP-dependent exoDNAse (exonuclease V) beta subunit
MSKPLAKTPPPDQAQRERALDPTNSILVQAPAGSGKTDLLTRRFLCLLTQVEDPGQIVAITFTKAAAAEMRHRILTKLEEAAATGNKLDPVKGTGFSPYTNPLEANRALAPEAHLCEKSGDPFSMESLARRALNHSQILGWNLLDQPAQLRISTIDSFCRDLALQQPLLSGLGDGLGIYEQPDELYRRAARQTLGEIDKADLNLRAAIESLLLWRDNNWQEMETLLVEMLKNRDRWMHGFVLEREQDWEVLRDKLERPFAKAILQSLTELSHLLDQVPGSRDEALRLARFACEQGAAALFQTLAELPDFPSDIANPDTFDEAYRAHICLADLLLTLDCKFRRTVDKRLGFPSDRKGEKAKILDLIQRLSAVPNLESALAAVRTLPPARYTDEDWQIVRACFTLLRNAAAQLRVVFAEAGAVDYIEVAQIAQNVLQGSDGLPTDAAIYVADGTHHILVDEFQDTSRRQHELLRRLIAAWPEREGRSCFVVGDPMQSIYFFRDADAELFPRVREAGLEIPNTDPLLFDPVSLISNFRTARPLVEELNGFFTQVFAADDGSGVTFSSAEPARNNQSAPDQPFKLHINFAPQLPRAKSNTANVTAENQEPRTVQIEEMVALIRSHQDRMNAARAKGENYRIAILGRTRNALAPIALVLRKAAIPFRAVDLEKLSARPEVLDALSLARAALNPLDRVAWLGVLRAPWCGLSLSDLHTLTSADDADLLTRPIPELLSERLHLLSNDGRLAAERVRDALDAVPGLRFGQPTASLGTWLEQVWLRLGGPQCIDRTARANLDLLWQCLDSLPNGEQDLLGPALNSALDSLTAQPDPSAGSDCGVQLMTIHKSKGLEFEVVVIPELQARSGRGKIKLLSWLERGLPPDDLSDELENSEEITEFLVAPLQSKGSDRGTTKQWVDRVYRERESQETRRILYVAATRARDELHLFAQPACKRNKSGDWILAEPKDSLLATAWPALQAEIENRFDAWKAITADPGVVPSIIESLAASAESNLLVMPAPLTPTLLRRLPPNFRPVQAEHSTPSAEAQPVVGMDADNRYQRHEGGLLSRALGTAVHALLDTLARLHKSNDWEATRASIKQYQPRIAAQVRAAGIDPTKAAAIATEALRIAIDATHDPIGNWILSPHIDDASEARWTGVVAGSLRTVQVDRVFRAGPTPLSTGNEAWWIIDYKTTHADAPDPVAALPQLRTTFAPQLLAYAEVLRKLHGTSAPVRAGLYYPRMLLFDYWEI